MDFIKKIKNYHDASYPGLFVTTHEEERFMLDMHKINAANPDISIHSWDAVNGLVFRAGNDPVKHQIKDSPHSGVELLKYLQSYPKSDNIFVLKDFHLHFDKPQVIRAFRNAWNYLKGNRNMVIIVGHKFALPPELHKEIQLLDYTLPDNESILENLNYIKDSVNSQLAEEDKPLLELSEAVAEAAVEAAKGMTSQEVENAFSVAYRTARKFDQSFVEAVFQEKIGQLKKNGLLTYMEPNISFDNVGGMHGLKNWLTSRKKAYSKTARDFNLPIPKGMLLASVPGTGKSLICKAIAKEFDCPLFSLDIGNIFDSLVGNSEKNMREMIKTVESIGKCVILID